MPIFLKVLNSILILFAVFMGLKHGWAMLTAKPEMLEMFSKWNIGKNGVIVYGAIGITSAIMILFPRTFVWGNFIMACGILLIVCFYLFDRNLKGVAIEIPFFLLNLVIIYFQHPLVKSN